MRFQEREGKGGGWEGGGGGVQTLLMPAESFGAFLRITPSEVGRAFTYKGVLISVFKAYYNLPPYCSLS